MHDVPYIHLLEKTGTEAMGTKNQKMNVLRWHLYLQLKPNKIIKPETYILVDDIYTTGTTLRHAATVLKEAGATRVEAVTLIRAER